MRAEVLLPAPVIVEQKMETLEQMSDRIAIAHGIPTTTLANLVSAESQWKADAVGDHGCSFGLTQQNTCTTSVTKEEALDPETALTIAAEDIKNHKEDRYTVCNCWGFLATRMELPRMAAIQPNTTPHIGAVAIFYYHDKQSGEIVKHIAEIVKISAAGFTVMETNFSHCRFDRRVIAWNDPHLAGFWSA